MTKFNEDKTIHSNDLNEDNHKNINSDFSRLISKRYKIIKKIGQGGMGLIYKAYDKKLKKYVAIKSIKSPLKKNIKEIEKEAIKIAQVEHNNVCQIYDFIIDKDVSYMVMQYIEGESLAKKIIEKRLTFEESINIAIQICDGMEAINSKSIIHRDLKPRNIIITRDNTAKIIDFGVSKFIKNPFDELSETINSLVFSNTEEFEVKGTINYMAPESLNGEEIDQRTDIYSFGLILYEMLSFNKVFESSTLASVINKILNNDIPRIKLNNKEIEEKINNIIKKSTAKEKSKRFKNFSAIKKELIKLKENNIKKIKIKKNFLLDKKNIIKSIKIFIISLITLYIILSFLLYLKKPKIKKYIALFTTKDKIKLINSKQIEQTSMILNEDSFTYFIKLSNNKILIEKYKATIFMNKINIRYNDKLIIDMHRSLYDINDGLILNNHFYITGTILDKANQTTGLILKINNNGKIIWEKIPERDKMTSSILKINEFHDNTLVILTMYENEKGVGVKLTNINSNGKILNTYDIKSQSNFIIFPEIFKINPDKLLLKYNYMKNKKKHIALVLLNKKLEFIKNVTINIKSMHNNVIKDNKDNVLVSYLSESFSEYKKPKLFLTQFNNNLNINWQRIYHDDVTPSKIVNINKDYYIFFNKYVYKFFPLFFKTKQNYAIQVDLLGNLKQKIKINKINFFSKSEAITNFYVNSWFSAVAEIYSIEKF